MDRGKLQQLAELRLKDAEVLLAAGHWDAAYYLLGYVVECAFKACIAQKFKLHTVPEKRLINSFYTHRLDELLVAADLKSALDSQMKADATLENNWDRIQDWSEAARYDIVVIEVDARAFHDAIIDPKSGLLPWL